jgi:Ca2+/Na+ antiporter
MDHSQILKRAWNILWSYKMLWVFGFLLALASAGGVRNYRPQTPDFNQRNPAFSFDQWRYRLTPEMQRALGDVQRLFSQEMIGFWIGLAITLVCLFLLVAIIFAIIRYVSTVSIIRMVDGHEATGEKVGFRQGWRLGWSRAAWRLFLIDLVIGIPLALIGLVMFGCSMLPLILAVTSQRGGAIAAFAMLAAGLICIWSILFMVIGLAVGLVINLIRRSCVLDGNGVIDSIKLGVKLFRRELKDASLMWLILAAIHIGYVIVIIPVVLVLVGIGLLVGGGAGLATYFGLQAAAGQATAIVTAVILGLGLFFIILGLPLNFLEGLRLTYFSTSWTLTYRELTGLKLVEAGGEAEPLPPVSGEADTGAIGTDSAAAGAAA